MRNLIFTFSVMLVLLMMTESIVPVEADNYLAVLTVNCNFSFPATIETGCPEILLHPGETLQLHVNVQGSPVREELGITKNGILIAEFLCSTCTFQWQPETAGSYGAFLSVQLAQGEIVSLFIIKVNSITGGYNSLYR